MALVKDNHQTPSKSFYENMLEIEFPHIPPYEFGDYDQQQQDNEDGLENPNHMIKVINNNNYVISNNNNNNNNNSPTISSSSSANSSNNGFSSLIHNHEDDNSLINFNNHSFHHENRVSTEIFKKLNRQIDHHHQSLQHLDEVSHLRSSSGDYQDSTNEWFYNNDSNNVVDLSQESTTTTQQRCFNKRPHMDDENTHAPKKQCITSASKKSVKPKLASKSKDPQSVAAKNRRERISEKLKILQDLVPNGSKVDLVTMLEKAIGYVKFLQLQMKVLATDEFWPVAGGKAPDISQVKDAIDAILSSQRSKACN
ncbi:hypothetical protein RND81_08G226100 [Saponaria officinalis]|uniref:BHLH domain-containing protein n=1 Tax=Saponaria officinalis TaxID=3572 RepID=A0AAW1JBB1_SAPOF